MLTLLALGCGGSTPLPGIAPPAIATLTDTGGGLVDPLAVDDTGGEPGPTFENPVAARTPDPHVSVHGDDVYLVYSPGDRIVLRRAGSLLDLNEAEERLIWEPPPDTMHSADLWGPELHRIDGRFVVYYSATDASFLGLSGNYRLWALEADGDDPFTATWGHAGPVVVPEQDAVATHPTVFEADGERFLAWSGRRAGLDFTNRIFVARLLDAFTVEGPGVELAEPIEEWEGGSLQSPSVLERGDRRILVYATASCIAAERSLGLLAQPASASPLDPWQSSPDPWLEADPVQATWSPGQPGFVTSPDGREDWLVYHAATASLLGCGDERAMHLNRVTWTPDGAVLEGPTGAGTPLPTPGGTAP